jgi:anti-sigma B factor antagonist
MNNSIIPGFDKEKDRDLRILLEKTGDNEAVLVMHLTGYIDSKNTIFFQDRAMLVIDSGFLRLILDCGGLNYVSSTGIGVFTTILHKMKEKGGNLIKIGRAHV